MKVRFKWRVEIEVDERWVADGFNLTEERLADLLSRGFPWMPSTEIAGRILKSPKPTTIECVQGNQLYPKVPR